MSEGFFSRWARRKEAVREGKPVEAEPAPVAEPSPQPIESPSPHRGEGGGEGQERQPPPTLEDVQSLTPQSDFRRFVASDVPVDVKNAALRKLFSDPHFNIMDRLDTYIDDYSQPDPIPPEMMKKLASARFLKLFDDEEDKDKKKADEGREVADDQSAQSVAQSDTSEPAVLPPNQDADTDLRLQQDHAPGPAGPGQGSE